MYGSTDDPIHSLLRDRLTGGGGGIIREHKLQNKLIYINYCIKHVIICHRLYEFKVFIKRKFSLHYVKELLKL